MHILSHSTAPQRERHEEQIENAQDEERQHTQACIKAYKRQLSMGRHFLHEHPVHQRWEDTFGERDWSKCSKNTKKELLIGSAPCKSFRTVLHRSEKGTKEQIEKAQDEERQNTQACIKAYKRLLSMGRDFLHEQCISAGEIHLVQGPMCRWHMAATGDRNEQGLVRGQTRWATSSSRHAGENRRVRVDWAERDRCTHRDL